MGRNFSALEENLPLAITHANRDSAQSSYVKWGNVRELCVQELHQKWDPKPKGSLAKPLLDHPKPCLGLGRRQHRAILLLIWFKHPAKEVILCNATCTTGASYKASKENTYVSDKSKYIDKARTKVQEKDATGPLGL